MQIKTTKIADVFTIELHNFIDNRGSFFKLFHETNFKNSGITANFKEIFFSTSHKNVIRGMHVQNGPMALEKLVTVLSGSMIDVVLDSRKNSPTFGQYIHIQIDAKHPQAIYVPKGCAHGFTALEDNTVVGYMVTEVHDPANDTGFLYNSFGYDWQVKHPIISERDLALPKFLDK